MVQDGRYAGFKPWSYQLPLIPFPSPGTQQKAVGSKGPSKCQNARTQQIKIERKVIGTAVDEGCPKY